MPLDLYPEHVIDLPNPTIDDLVMLWDVIAALEAELDIMLDDDRAAHARIFAALRRAGVV